MNTKILPQDYKLLKKFDLKEDKNINLFIQLLFVLIAGSMILLSIGLKFPMRPNWHAAVTIIVTILLCMVYIVLHEMIHGIFIKLLSGVKPDFYFRLPLIATGSSKAYFERKSFIIIALAPVIILGVILIALLFFVASNFFLSVYIVLILNFAGASGDYIQVYAIARLPETALIQDTGKETLIYTAEK